MDTPAGGFLRPGLSDAAGTLDVDIGGQIINMSVGGAVAMLGASAMKPIKEAVVEQLAKQCLRRAAAAATAATAVSTNFFGTDESRGAGSQSTRVDRAIGSAKPVWIAYSRRLGRRVQRSNCTTTRQPVITACESHKQYDCTFRSTYRTTT